MTKKYNVSLSSSDIKEMVEELVRIREGTKAYARNVTNSLLDTAVGDAVRNLEQMSGQTGYEPTHKIADSIVKETVLSTGERSNWSGKVVVNDPAGAYAEYGTGVVGLKHKHPMPIGWNYDSKKHGNKGWFYKDDAGVRYWTRGQRSKPFLYNSMQELRAQLNKLAKMHKIV